MVGLMPSMAMLGLLLRRNPFDQKPTLEDLAQIDDFFDRSSG
jgi:hypothetical protein